MINGPKAWCTFAGRADVLAVLCSTDPEKGQRGLSLLIVPKQRETGHTFETVQPGGGRVVGKADATPGYRGMHSFTLNFENFFVPAANLVGLAEGEGHRDQRDRSQPPALSFRALAGAACRNEAALSRRRLRFQHAGDPAPVTSLERSDEWLSHKRGRVGLRRRDQDDAAL